MLLTGWFRNPCNQFQVIAKKDRAKGNPLNATLTEKQQ